MRCKYCSFRRNQTAVVFITFFSHLAETDLSANKMVLYLLPIINLKECQASLTCKHSFLFLRWVWMLKRVQNA